MANFPANQYCPDSVSHPGTTLEDLLSERGITQAQLAERMGRPKKTINEIIKGKTAITSETALQFERVLHVSAIFWMRREADYQAHLARAEEAKRLRGEVDCLRVLPVRTMVQLGWIEGSSSRVDQLRHVFEFFGVASANGLKRVTNLGGAAFRRSTTFRSDPYALAAWLRRGEILAHRAQAQIATYDESTFISTLQDIRTFTQKLPTDFAQEVSDMCAASGVILLFIPELPKAHVSGVARWVIGHPVIQLSLRHKTDDHLWFTFFHEAAHILKHSKQNIFIDEAKGRSEDDDDEEAEPHQEDDREREANEAASQFLVPQKELDRFAKANKPFISKDAIMHFASKIGVAPGIVVGQLQHRGHIPYRNCNDLKRRFTRFTWPRFETPTPLRPHRGG